MYVVLEVEKFVLIVSYYCQKRQLDIKNQTIGITPNAVTFLEYRYI